MANLIDYLFTPRNDNATSLDGWLVNPGQSVNSLTGNDLISGSNGGFFGIWNFGSINTGTGKDVISGSNTGDSGQCGIINNGIISVESGNDLISGSGGFGGAGIINDGTINGGDGNDVISGSALDEAIGIINDGIIDCGNGNDSIIGRAGKTDFYGAYGISVSNGSINGGMGNDEILGTAGDGGCGIRVYGAINGDAGNDVIRGIAGVNGTGIYNDGIISGGDGNDLVDALTGGFKGSGTVFLGAGNDTLNGFGEGKFVGGNGKDKLVFNPGSYTIASGDVLGTYLINNIMVVSEFELFGAGANVSSFATAAALGSVTFA